MNIRKILLVIIYFLCAVPMYYLYEGSVIIGGFGFMYCYLAPIPFILVAFGVFLVNPDLDRAVTVGKIAWILSLPLLLTVLYSLVLWIGNFASFRNMTRGGFAVVYQLIAIVMAGAAAYCFGKKAVYYQMGALLIAFLMLIADLIREGGASEFIRQYVQLIATASRDGGYMMKTIERAAFAHGIGIYLFYLLLTFRERKINLLIFAAAVPFFLMGFKRSALVGISIGIAACLALALTPRKARIKMAYAEILLMIVGGFLYIGVISSGLLEAITDSLQIDTMGRIRIYNSMKPYYEFDPTYLGKGIGYSSYMIGSGMIDVGDAFAGDIHSDFLRQYVELGMFGFLVWLVMFFYWRFRALLKTVDRTYGYLVVILFAYCFGCYFTENMYYNFKVTIAIAAVFFSYAVQRLESKKEEEEDAERT